MTLAREEVQRIVDRWRGWSLPTQAERHAKRRCSTLDELTDFYAAMLPRMDELIAHLNGLPLSKLEGADRDLLNLCLCWIDVALAVELFGEPDESTAMPAARFTIATSEPRGVVPGAR